MNQGIQIRDCLPCHTVERPGAKPLCTLILSLWHESALWHYMASKSGISLLQLFPRSAFLPFVLVPVGRLEEAGVGVGNWALAWSWCGNPGGVLGHSSPVHSLRFEVKAVHSRVRTKPLA